MKRALLVALLLAVPIGCGGPESPSRPKPAASVPEMAAAPARQPSTSAEHGHALLYSLLGDERHVSRLLLIKFERKELNAVIGAIDETCSRAYKRLGDLAALDPQVDLEDTGLPVAETRTREAIRETTKHELLAAKGPELEFQLLLTQNEALGYGAHLANALARSETDPARLAFERELSADLSRLQQDVRALLREPAPRR